MNILVTGARGFVGKNFVESLKNIKYNKDRTRPELKIDDILSMTSIRITIHLNNFVNLRILFLTLPA